MGQAKTKVECPLCGGRSDTDDGCETASVDGADSHDKDQSAPAFDAAKPLLTPLLALHDDDDDGGGRNRGGHASTASLPAYAGTGPLTSVAEEPGLADEAGGGGALTENHTAAASSQRLVVFRGNRHHPPGHRVR